VNCSNDEAKTKCHSSNRLKAIRRVGPEQRRELQFWLAKILTTVAINKVCCPGLDPSQIHPMTIQVLEEASWTDIGQGRFPDSSAEFLSAMSLSCVDQRRKTVLYFGHLAENLSFGHSRILPRKKVISSLNWRSSVRFVIRWNTRFESGFKNNRALINDQRSD
jgi:hypothetical protein